MPLTPVPLEQLNRYVPGTLLQALGIAFTRVTEEALEATMPVDARTHQIYGVLHGGASMVLAETLASVGGTLCIDRERFRCYGMEINANHIRPVSQGTVTGTARPLHIGKSTQVWDIQIRDEQDRLICMSRMTLAVVAI